MKKLFSILACALMFLTAQAMQFKQVVTVDSLNSGDEIVFGYSDETVTRVSTTFLGNKKAIDVVNATLQDSVMSVEGTSVITLTKLAGGNYTMKIGTKPIGHKSGVKDLDTNQKTTTEFAISFNADGTATVASQTSDYYFYYNPGSPRFALYTASATNTAPIRIYKKLATPVIPVDAESVALSEHALSVRMGETGTLTATVLPEDAADKSVSWHTTNAAIATVANGVITPVAVGTVDIYAETTVGAHRDTCHVTILAAIDNTPATYNIVQFPDTLKSGTLVFFGTANTSKDYVMARYVSGTNIKGVAATYGTDRHSVTAELQYAYTVEREGDVLYFRDCDGRYLSAQSGGNTTAVNAKDDNCKWTLTIDSDNGISTLKSGSNTSNKLLFNATASPVCFKAYGGTSTNIYDLTIYASNAPEWYERVRNPKITVTETALDWGTDVPENNIWGSIKYLHFTTEDLAQAAQIIYTGSDAFTCYWDEIPASKTSGQIPVEWETESTGTYSGEIRIVYPGLDDIVIPLSAKAVMPDDPSLPQPFITVSTERIYINLSYENYCEDGASFTFSAGNLDKALYCKWENGGSMPTWNGTWYEAQIGTTSLTYGSTTNLGTDDITDATLEFYIGATQLGNYSTSFYFYTYKGGVIVAEKRVEVIITVTEEPTPDPTALDESQMSNVKSKIINILGQPVGPDYHGIVIRNGKKLLQP